MNHLRVWTVVLKTANLQKNVKALHQKECRQKQPHHLSYALSPVALHNRFQKAHQHLPDSPNKFIFTNVSIHHILDKCVQQ